MFERDCFESLCGLRLRCKVRNIEIRCGCETSDVSRGNKRVPECLVYVERMSKEGG